MKEEIAKKMCCTGHYKEDDEVGDLDISVKHIFTPSWKIEGWMMGTGRTDHCGN
jgi:hypothetical protein